VLKKAGMVVAVAAAGLLAVSPLAFAGSEGGHRTSHSNVNGDQSTGLVNVTDNDVNTPIQACNNDVPVNGGAGAVQTPVKDVTTALSGAAALFGTAKSSVDQDTDSSRECGDNSGSTGDLHKQ
jgi:hypothetical protein